MPDAPLTFLFSGGGTGGHLYPGLAIAESLRARSPDARCVFLCSDRAIDAKILRAEGAVFEPIHAKPFGVRPGALLAFVRSWPGAVAAARAIIRREADGAGGLERVRLIAMGGFVAAPCVAAARSLGVPIAMLNLDAVPGKANRWIAKRASVVMSATGESERVPSTWRRIPPVVRSAALGTGTAAQRRARLGLDPSLPTLFVSGGSQGARSINTLMIRLAANNAPTLKGWQVFHQTGENDEVETRHAYSQAGIPALVCRFCDKMGDAWGGADLAIARCGAGTVGEVWASATPTIFLPYPYHKDEHQKWNAKPLEATGGVVVCKDRIDPAANDAEAGEAIRRLLIDSPARDRMRAALRALGPADGADRAADAIHAL